MIEPGGEDEYPELHAVIQEIMSGVPEMSRKEAAELSEPAGQRRTRSAEYDHADDTPASFRRKLGRNESDEMSVSRSSQEESRAELSRGVKRTLQEIQQMDVGVEDEVVNPNTGASRIAAADVEAVTEKSPLQVEWERTGTTGPGVEIAGGQYARESIPEEPDPSHETRCFFASRIVTKNSDVWNKTRRGNNFAAKARREKAG
jgi:hypothetical protein